MAPRKARADVPAVLLVTVGCDDGAPEAVMVFVTA